MLFGIIGCGRIARTHAKQMIRHGKILAVCDTSKQKADNLAAEFHTNSYSSYEEMFKLETELQLVSICTPNGLHAQHSIAALKKGLHVLCEKPMALSVRDCEEMISVSQSAGRELFIVKQNRYNPPVMAVKKLLDEGILGKIYSLQLNCFWNRNQEYYENTWKGKADMDGGTLFTQFSHFIDLLYWMIGDVKQVHAFAGNFGHRGLIEFEDTGVVVMQFEQGAIATINYTVNSFSKNMEGSLTIFGEKGTVKIGGEYLNKLEYQAIQDYTISRLPVGNDANEYDQYRGSMSNHNKVFENVIEVLENKGSIMTSAFEALKTVEIIKKIYSATTIIN